jgi:hypothetical protein
MNAYPVVWRLSLAPETRMGQGEGPMSGSEERKLSEISQAATLDELVDFWDSHSLADYWDQTQEVEFDVRARGRRRVTLDPDLYDRIEAAARLRGILPETLVNLWLTRKLEETEPDYSVTQPEG